MNHDQDKTKKANSISEEDATASNRLVVRDESHGSISDADLEKIAGGAGQNPFESALNPFQSALKRFSMPTKEKMSKDMELFFKIGTKK